MAVKLRPYLTVEEIQSIVKLIDETPDATAADPYLKSARRTLVAAAIKVNNGLVTGSYTERKRPSMEEKLGLADQSSKEVRYLAGEMSPEEEAEYVSNLVGA